MDAAISIYLQKRLLGGFLHTHWRWEGDSVEMMGGVDENPPQERGTLLGFSGRKHMLLPALPFLAGRRAHLLFDLISFLLSLLPTTPGLSTFFGNTWEERNTRYYVWGVWENLPDVGEKAGVWARFALPPE